MPRLQRGPAAVPTGVEALQKRIQELEAENTALRQSNMDAQGSAERIAELEREKTALEGRVKAWEMLVKEMDPDIESKCKATVLLADSLTEAIGQLINAEATIRATGVGTDFSGGITQALT